MNEMEATLSKALKDDNKRLRKILCKRDTELFSANCMVIFELIIILVLLFVCVMQMGN